MDQTKHFLKEMKEIVRPKPFALASSVLYSVDVPRPNLTKSMRLAEPLLLNPWTISFNFPLKQECNRFEKVNNSVISACRDGGKVHKRYYTRYFGCEEAAGPSIVSHALRDTSSHITAYIFQCCGSGSGIRDLVPFWPLDPGWVKNQDPEPGWTTQIIFPRA